MKPKTIFTIYAAFMAVAGLGGLVSPQTTIAMLQLPPDTPTFLLGNIAAVQLGLAAIYGLARNARASEARDALLLGGGILQAILTAGLLMELGSLPTEVLVGGLVFPVLFLIGFFTIWQKHKSSASTTDQAIMGGAQEMGQ